MSPQSGELLLNEIAPRLYRTVPQRVPMIGAEDAQELCQDALAMAAAMLERLDNQNKRVTPGNIAFYTVQLLKSGRRSIGSSKADAMASGTRLSGRATVQSLDEPINLDDEDALTLADFLSDDSEDPSLAAARKLDWEAFLKNVDAREHAVIRTLAEGGQLQEAAREYGASASCFSDVKRRLKKEVELYWGPSGMALR